MSALLWALPLKVAHAAATWAPEPTLSPLAQVAPFVIAGTPESQARATACLASAIYYEAGNQTLSGRQAVAQVVLNRVRHPRFPKTVCGVVYQGASRSGCQFTFACDGSLRRAPDPLGWRSAEAVAQDALGGFVASSVGASTHYHATYVHPLWSDTLVPIALIGAHRFYHLPGPTGAPDGLTGRYAAQEPTPELARSLQQERWQQALGRGPAASLRAAPAVFSVWGLSVGVITPKPDGSVSIAAADPS